MCLPTYETWACPNADNGSLGESISGLSIGAEGDRWEQLGFGDFVFDQYVAVTHIPALFYCHSRCFSSLQCSFNIGAMIFNEIPQTWPMEK